MLVSREVHVGAVVIYRPDKTSESFHDKGFCRRLPAIVTKVWSSGAANLRVAADHPVEDDNKVDIRVFLDHNGKDRDAYVWVFGATFGTGQDQWSWPE